MKYNALPRISIILLTGAVGIGVILVLFSKTGGDAKEIRTKTINDPAFDLPADPDQSGWTQTSGPLGGTVIRMVPHNGTLWASLYSGGIYELQKSGLWKQIAIGHGIPENRAFDIVEDPRNINTTYVPETIACIAKTVNGGQRWKGLCDRMLSDIKANNFSAHTLVFDPDDRTTLYVPGHTEDHTSMLLASADGGQHWEKRFVFSEPYDFNHLVFFNTKMYLTTVENGVLVSSDKGKQWKLMNNGLNDATTARFTTFKNRLYLFGARLQHNVRVGGGLYRLALDESSWQQIKQIDNATGLGSDGNTLFVGTMDTALWTSSDGATFARKKSLGLPPDWVGDIVNVGSTIYVSAGGNGVFRSSDGGNHFAEFNVGMTSVATREMYVNPNDENEIYVITWDRLGFYWSKNSGKTYKRLATDMYVLTLKPDPHDFAHVYLGGDQLLVGTISKSGGQFTKRIKPGSNDSFIKSIAVDPRDTRHILVGIASAVAETPPGEGLWESRDQGKHWARAKGIGNNAPYSILFHPTNPNIVYASALGSGVFKSTDGGSHFTPIGDNALQYTYRLAMSTTDPNVLVASSNLFFGQLTDAQQISGTYGGIFQSKDGGSTWKELTKGIRAYEGGNTPEEFQGWLYNFGHLPNYEMILIDPNDSNHLIVGHHGENVVVTRDGGTTWEKQGAEEMVPGNIHNYAYCLGSSSHFNKIYACTCGRGLFRGTMNPNGQIAWNIVSAAWAKEFTIGFKPRNAQEARQFILSGAYNHKH